MSGRQKHPVPSEPPEPTKQQEQKGPPPQPGQQTPLIQDLLRLLCKLAGIAVVVLLVFTFVYGVFQTHGLEMDPAVRDGDLILYYRLDQTCEAGETVVVNYRGKKQIRRVAAVAGDTVDIREEGLQVNGMYQEESRVTGQTRRYADGAKLPVTLKEGQIFVLADNRENAVDSRVYGPVEEKDILGKAMTIVRRKEI